MPKTEGELVEFIREIVAQAVPNLGILSRGAGSPNGVVTADPGCLYLSSAGGAATTLYVKESGVGTNTGWVAK